MARSDKQRMALAGSEPSAEPVLRRRQRVIVMTPIDEAVFSEALREAHPRVAFGDDAARRDSIADCKVRTVTIWFDGSAAPRRQSGRCGSGSAGVVAAVGRLFFGRSALIWNVGRLTRNSGAQLAFDPPMLTSGHLSATWNEAYAAHAAVPAFQREVWRILERVAVNRLKGGTPLSNTLEWGCDVVNMADAKLKGTCLVWAGHHALEWCAAGGPRRMLDGAFRPCDDWAPPSDPWYQSLRRRAEERHGPDFAAPPEEELPGAGRSVR